MNLRLCLHEKSQNQIYAELEQLKAVCLLFFNYLHIVLIS